MLILEACPEGKYIHTVTEEEGRMSFKTNNSAREKNYFISLSCTKKISHSDVYAISVEVCTTFITAVRECPLPGWCYSSWILHSLRH